MIEKYKLESFISILSELNKIVIIRNDQMAKKPLYPYATYKLINSNNESAKSNILEKSNIDNSETVYRYSENTISIQVYSDSYDSALAHCIQLNYSLVEDKIENDCYEKNYSLALGLTAISDRTIVLESDYEYRFGFDLVIKTQTEFKREIDLIEKIEINLEEKNSNNNITIEVEK